jgi:hypothetical protein
MSGAEIAERFTALERIIARDPGRRGIGPLVQPGHLERACRALARLANVRGNPIPSPEGLAAPSDRPRVVIITGFLIPGADAAETDGPPGAVALQRALVALGVDAVILTDKPCAAVCAGAGASPLWVLKSDPESSNTDTPATAGSEPTGDFEGLAQRDLPPPDRSSIDLPREAGGVAARPHPASREREHFENNGSGDMAMSPATLEDNVRSPVTLGDVARWLGARSGACLISIERCGRGADGRYRTMRARDITDRTAPLDDLFLRPPDGLRRIAVGDGGNEIGMGLVADQVAQVIPNGAVIGSQVGCDDLIVAGVSNWGAWGLIAGLRLLTGRDLLPTLEAARQSVVGAVEAGAVDGVAGLPQTTVDGLGFEHHRDILLALGEAIR